MDTNKLKDCLEENINFDNVGPIWGENYQYRSRIAIRNFLKNNLNKESPKEELLKTVSLNSKGLFSPALILEEINKFKNSNS